MHPRALFQLVILSVALSLAAQPNEPAAPPSLNILAPAAKESLRCRKHPDGIYHFRIEGISSNVSATRQTILIWVEPVDPPSERSGWYLQRLPVNGVNVVAADGGWSGVGQVGSAEYPPHDGDVIDVAVSVTDKATADDLLSREGLVVERSPIGVATAIVRDVVLSIANRK